jgi:hypothetical protein
MFVYHKTSVCNHTVLHITYQYYIYIFKIIDTSGYHYTYAVYRTA